MLKTNDPRFLMELFIDAKLDADGVLHGFATGGDEDWSHPEEQKRSAITRRALARSGLEQMARA